MTNYTVSWLNTALGIEADRLVLRMIQEIPVADYAKGLLYTMLSMVRSARTPHPADQPHACTPTRPHPPGYEHIFRAVGGFLSGFREDSAARRIAQAPDRPGDTEVHR